MEGKCENCGYEPPGTTYEIGIIKEKYTRRSGPLKIFGGYSGPLDQIHIELKSEDDWNRVWKQILEIAPC